MLTWIFLSRFQQKHVTTWHHQLRNSPLAKDVVFMGLIVSTNVLRATMRENIPIWRRLRRKEKSRKLCTLGVHGMKMNAMRDQIKPCHLLHLQSSLISKRIIPLQIGFQLNSIDSMRLNRSIPASVPPALLSLV